MLYFSPGWIFFVEQKRICFKGEKDGKAGSASFLADEGDRPTQYLHKRFY